MEKPSISAVFNEPMHLLSGTVMVFFQNNPQEQGLVQSKAFHDYPLRTIVLRQYFFDFFSNQ